ncbi:SMI1/KNR4 family protein [Gimesia sp.]|uniref:SMI1/KNR4 family protein n=1 Tax=Gimesia sp. TaxID=2024833 RepID=UPI0032EFF91F
MTETEKAWASIRTWYEANVKEPPYADFFDWGSPASDEAFETVEDAIMYRLPSDLRDTYLMYNGDNKMWVLPGGYLMDLDEVLTTWNMFKEPVDNGLFDDSDASPDGPIKQIWWNPFWIPVLHNGGGDYHCVDMDPAVDGVVGQFIKFQHETGPSHVLAPSFGDFVITFANDLASGKYEFDLEEGAVRSVAK